MLWVAQDVATMPVPQIAREARWPPCRWVDVLGTDTDTVLFNQYCMAWKTRYMVMLRKLNENSSALSFPNGQQAQLLMIASRYCESFLMKVMIDDSEPDMIPVEKSCIQ